MRRSRLLAPALALAAVGAVAVGTAGPTGVLGASSECPNGTIREHDVTLTDFASGARSACVPSSRVESVQDLMAMNAQLGARQGLGMAYSAGAMEAAAAQYQAMAAASPSGPGWQPVGRGPLNDDVAGFGRTDGSGFHQLGGRIEDFAYDPASPSDWYAAVANGGVWETTNGGGLWKSIGDHLPTQITGAVELLRDGKNKTVVVGTGDPAFGGNSFSGLGLYWSTGGDHWTKSRGVPNGALTFNIDHDPARPSVVYAATSKGLYRSTDAARSFVNVVLPTTCMSVNKPVCFFANMVTDVVVRRAGHGDPGGEVLAAVGWRAGQKLNAVGKPQSPRNGLYLSSTGRPGTFTYMSNPGTNDVATGVGSGFATNDVVGRVALGNATGSLQDHGYVYALVQDAQKFNHAATAFDLPEPTGKVPGNTVFNGLYGSKDFGKTWTKLADAAQLAAPGSGTALTGANAATYAPGVQSWYNEWVQVDPTVQDETGVPGRIAFGLEEIWTGAGAFQPVPDSGQFHVVGKYWAGASCGGLNLGGILNTTDAPCPLSADLQNPTGATANQGTTTHPDQHGGVFIPQPAGGVVLLAGNDGGAFKQTLKKGAALAQNGWGKGINNGFNTLLPYDAEMSSDGTTVMGLQDNGSAVISPEGKITGAYDGDGFFVAIDPDKPGTWYEEYTAGSLHVTTDGGRDWSTIDPGLTSALFSTPFVMDPTNSKHLVIGGREIAETTQGSQTQGATNVEAPDINAPKGTPSNDGSWIKVFDLGTQQHPGSATAGRSGVGKLPVVGDPLASEINNQMSAVDTLGDATYVGYCGYCDIVTGGTPFHSGIATNVGGSQAPKFGTSNGWHIAAARGLPQRYINSVRIDPSNPRIVYVTLGGYGRKWIPPGSLGDNVSKIGRGHVFMSVDAGQTFKDISGNLPDIGAEDALPFNGSLVVATDLGVFIGDLKGHHFQVLGHGMPMAPVFRINRTPANPRELVAASFGRGAYRIMLPAGYAGQATHATSVYSAQDVTPPALLSGPGAAAPPARIGSGSATSAPAASNATATSMLKVATNTPWAPAALALVLIVGVGAGIGLRRRATRG